MTKTLIKKQLNEVFAWLYQDQKTGKVRTKAKLLSYIILYIIVFGFVAAVFGFLAAEMCPTLVELGYGWLYIALMSILALLFAVFGSVFNTYATLYKAKDNDLLLAMPIPVNTIMTARLSGVFAMGLFYEVLIMLPTLVIFFIYAHVGVLEVIYSILLTVLISLVALAFSCILGWVVALISARLKNQKILTVIVALVLFAIYYYICGSAGEFIGRMLQDPSVLAGNIKGSFTFFYLGGLAACGDSLAMLKFAAICIGFFAIVYLVMRRNFLKLATVNRGEKKLKYVEKQAKQASVGKALFTKELRRFTGSVSYMLNCGLGIVIAPILAIFLLVEQGEISWAVDMLAGQIGDMLYPCVAAVVLFTSIMCDISAPSISLEGKSLWLSQSLPVESYEILKAKRNLHIVLTLIPHWFLALVLLYLVGFDPVFTLLTLIMVAAFVFLMASLGVLMNLKHPNLTWTNETVPIKQSSSVTVALFGGWGIVIVLGAAGYFLMKVVSPFVTMVILTLVIIAICAYLTHWLKTKGSAIFARL